MIRCDSCGVAIRWAEASEHWYHVGRRPPGGHYPVRPAYAASLETVGHQPGPAREWAWAEAEWNRLGGGTERRDWPPEGALDGITLAWGLADLLRERPD